jgi:hypothetical protein
LNGNLKNPAFLYHSEAYEKCFHTCRLKHMSTMMFQVEIGIMLLAALNLNKDGNMVYSVWFTTSTIKQENSI